MEKLEIRQSLCIFFETSLSYLWFYQIPNSWPWGRKELDTAEQLNWTELKFQCYAWLPDIIK